MNRYYAKLELMETFSKVRFHDKVIDEVMNLVIGKGIEEQFMNVMSQRKIAMWITFQLR